MWSWMLVILLYNTFVKSSISVTWYVVVRSTKYLLYIDSEFSVTWMHLFQLENVWHAPNPAHNCCFDHEHKWLSVWHFKWCFKLSIMVFMPKLLFCFFLSLQEQQHLFCCAALHSHTEYLNRLYGKILLLVYLFN